MSKASKLCKSEEGAGLLLCVFVLFVMLGVGGLAVDMGIIYKTRGAMRKAANAAVLSGAQVMFESNSTITGVVDYVLEEHEEKESLESLAIKPNGENKVTVTLKKDVPLYFMKIFDVDSAPVELDSSAMAGPLSTGFGVVPIGLPDNIALKVGESYPLNLEPGEGISGNYNYLDFSSVKTDEGKTVINPGTIKNHGASALEEYLQNGYNGEIELNYQIETKTGINAGKVAEAITYRLNSPNPDDRILLIILFDNTRQENGKSTRYVTGFAYFQLKGLVDIVKNEDKDKEKEKDKDKDNGNNKQIIGKFISKVTTGSIKDGAVDYKSAYAIKLVE